jgi:hypothetical protein
LILYLRLQSSLLEALDNLIHGVPKMLLQSLIAITDNRKRMALLTLLTFAVLC